MPQHTSGSDRAAVSPAARDGGSVRPPAPSTLDELWRSYKTTGDERLREQLILHYSPLVKYVAGRVSVGLPANVEQADFVSSGVFGLIDAIEKFDIDREIKFETYAITRIRGAMIDELRALDWIPRSVRQKARNVERAYATLEARLQAHPVGGRGGRRDGHRGRRTPRGLQPVVAGQRGGAGGAAACRGRGRRPAEPDGHAGGHRRGQPGRGGRGPGAAPASWRGPSTRCPSGRRPSSRCTTTRGSPSRRSATCWG